MKHRTTFDLKDWVVSTSLMSPTEKGIFIDLVVFSLLAKKHGCRLTTDDLDRMKRGYTEREIEAFNYVLENYFDIKDGKVISDAC